MPSPDFIVIGSKGLIGTAVMARLHEAGAVVLGVDRNNYAAAKGSKGNVLINCNGNASRFKASEDPLWDFRASVESVAASLFDFQVDTYIYLSTVDVYHRVDQPEYTREETPINEQILVPYAFHKWISECLVERYAPHSVILRLGTALGPQLKKNPIYDLLHGNPLFISADSQLSFIDTATIAESVMQVLETRPQKEIYNVAATGSTRIKDVAAKLRIQFKPSKGPELPRRSYNISNAKICQLMKIPTSDDVVSRYLESVSALKSS